MRGFLMVVSDRTSCTGMGRIDHFVFEGAGPSLSFLR